ncbi:TPR domain protein [Aspergillus venezuelensis]
MDMHDVSHEADYARKLQFQKANLAKARSLKGQRPKSNESRDEVIMQFMFQQMTTGVEVYGKNSMRTSFVPPAYPPSVKPFRELKKIMLKSLTLETHHRGSYVVLRAVTPTLTMTGTMLIVEDENGDVVKLTLYNQGEDLTTDRGLAEGNVMMVKEPYLKVMGDGGHGIRVDHLSDIFFLSEYDICVPAVWGPRVIDPGISADDWKTEGNYPFKAGQYNLAIEFYSKALGSLPSTTEAVTIRLNRALSCLHCHRFDAALHDLDIVLTDNKLSEKALFRKAQALYHLHRFQECCDVHTILAREYSNNAMAKKEFNRAAARLEEQNTGLYDFSRMQLEGKKLSPPVLDHATYVGPVAARQAGSSGRGLFTTKAVKAGDLLFCEKAFVYAFQDETSHAISTLLNIETGKGMMGTSAEVITLAAQKMYNNPSQAPAFTNLHHGSYKPVNVSEVDGKPIVDTFLIERTVSLNSFGCSRSTRGSHLDVKLNSPNADKAKIFHSSGIWCLASYLNHSCYSNTVRSFIGDMMIARAAQDLPANTELTFAYSSPFDRSNDPDYYKENWGFTCNCGLCLDARNIGDLAKRGTITAGLSKAFEKHKPNLTKIQSLLSALEQTYRYPAPEAPRIKSSDAYFALCRLNLTGRKHEDAVAAGLKGFKALGYIIEVGDLPSNAGPQRSLIIKKWGLMEAAFIACWMSLALAYRGLGSNFADTAEYYARITYRICIGEDETFDDTYSQDSGRLDGFLKNAK